MYKNEAVVLSLSASPKHSTHRYPILGEIVISSFDNCAFLELSRHVSLCFMRPVNAGAFVCNCVGVIESYAGSSPFFFFKQVPPLHRDQYIRP